jgi:CubicO group peptidase (beta-lactamase class C family)
LPGAKAAPTAPEPPPAPSQASLKAIVSPPPTDRTELARTIDRLFDEEAVGETRALLVLRGGEPVIERYGEGYGRKTRFIGWSMTKCVTGIMIGLLVSDGRLRRDESAPVALWMRPGDPRGEITLRQLLQMRSGLRHSENIEPIHDADTTRMMFLDGRDNMARFAEAQPLEAEPGSVYKYSSATSVILSDIAAQVLTRSTDPDRRRQVVAGFLRTRLFDPAGMDSMVPEFDASGTFIGSSMLHGNGARLEQAGRIPAAWRFGARRADHPASVDRVHAARPRRKTLVSARTCGSTGAIPMAVRSCFPKVRTKSAFACIGHLGQYVIASPEQKHHRGPAGPYSRRTTR